MTTVTLEVPTARDEVEFLRLLRLELAMTLFRDGYISPGRAAEFAGVGRWEFGDLAKARGIATPYTSEMLHEDFAHGGCH